MEHVYQHVLERYWCADRVITGYASIAFVQGILVRPSLDHNAQLHELAAVVCKAWNVESKILMRTEIQALRAAFFGAALELAIPKCLDCTACLSSDDAVCNLRMESVSHTMLELRVSEDFVPTSGEDCDADYHAACVQCWIEHIPVDRRQEEIRMLLPGPDGPAPVGDGYTRSRKGWRLDGKPHYYILDTDRTEAQRAEAQAWLAELSRDMLEWVWTEFRRLNGRPWWVTRWHNAEGVARFETL